MKALAEIGWARAARFAFFTLAMVPYRCLLVPPLRVPVAAPARRARSARAPILHDVRFFNLYRRGLRGFEVGDDCFLGRRVPPRPAEGIRLEAQVTLAERVLILTHTNVGYHDHPLQACFPAPRRPS